MRRFRFRLDQLLRYQRQLQRQADLLLQQALGERDVAQNEVDEAERRLRHACQSKIVPGRLIDPTQREQSVRHVERLDQIVRACQERLESAELRLREAQEHRTKVTQDVEALLHLRKQEWLAFQDESAKRLQIEVDEVVMRQWSRRGRRVESAEEVLK